MCRLITWMVIYTVCISLYSYLFPGDQGTLDLLLRLLRFGCRSLTVVDQHVGIPAAQRCYAIVSGLEDRANQYALKARIASIRSQLLDAFPGEAEVIERAVLSIQEFLKSNSNGALVLRLVGPTGTGKRRFARTLMEFFSKGRSPEDSNVRLDDEGITQLKGTRGQKGSQEGLVVEGALNAKPDSYTVLQDIITWAAKGTTFVIIDDVNDFGVSPSMLSSISLSDAQELAKQVLLGSQRPSLSDDEIIVPFLPKSGRVIEANILQHCRNQQTGNALICPVHAAAQAAMKLGACIDEVGFEKAFEIFTDVFDKAGTWSLKSDGANAMEVLILDDDLDADDKDSSACTKVSQWFRFRPIDKF